MASSSNSLGNILRSTAISFSIQYVLFSFMKATFFGRTFPPPSACPKVFSRRNSPCTRCTANAGEPLLVKSTNRHIILFNKLRDHFPAPVQERVIFDHLVCFIPFQKLHLVTVPRLVATDPGYPDLGSGKSTPQWFYFTDIAAFFSVFYRIVEAVRSLLKEQLFYFRSLRKIDRNRYFVLLT